MRVFILSTGRSGSKTFTKACEHINNYSCGHETLTRKIGNERVKYPINHIEADNRLVWNLGLIDKTFNDDVLYVHLKRNKQKIAKSLEKRFYRRSSIIHTYCEGIKMIPPEKLTKEEKYKVCLEFIDTVYANIECFFLNKKNAIIVNLEDIKKDFPIFWDRIGAKGDIETALKVFDTSYNASSSVKKDEFLYRFKLYLLRIWRSIFSKYF